jgi:hypothetical protein
MDSDQTAHVYEQILRMLRMRVAGALRVDEAEVPAQTVGDLANILFLLHGQFGCLGDYNVTVRALYTFLGDSLWAKPETIPGNPRASALVQ